MRFKISLQLIDGGVLGRANRLSRLSDKDTLRKAGLAVTCLAKHIACLCDVLSAAGTFIHILWLSGSVVTKTLVYRDVS